MIKIQMIKRGLQKLSLSLIVASSLLFSVMAQANEDSMPMEIPDTAATIWQMIDQETQEMADLIEAGNLDDLHHHAFTIRDLVAALPERSVLLSAEKLTQVKANGKFIAVLAARLDEAGDSGDKSAAESNFQKMNALLKSIRTNYGILKDEHVKQ